MSRVIVKNLPKAVSEQKIRDTFSSKGTITDVQLKYKDGKFRQFAFLGFVEETSAAEAVKFFDNTFIGTSKIRVEVCSDLGHVIKSKFTKEDGKIKTKATEVEAAPVKKDISNEPKKSKKTAKIEAIMGDHKNDPLFQEFLQSHAKDKLSWENDIATGETAEKVEEVLPEEIEDEEEEKIANAGISDMDYMKNLIQGTTKVKKEIKTSYETKDKKPKEDLAKLFTIKMRNIPQKVKREDIVKFFRPSKAHSVRIPRTGCFAYVGFKLERDLQRALTKDKSFFKGKQINVYDFTEKNFLPEGDNKSGVKENPRWQQQAEQLEGEEAICESGKLFFRNLAYSVKEEDLQEVFEKFGTVVEVNVPIDTVTRKIKGFGTVTFMMPENALQAYSELNGTIFHGRMFHLLPGKANDNKSDEEDENSSNFKKKKQQDQRKSAASSHNWNTLFLGANAVAEVMSKTYGRSKEQILDSTGGGSNAAVRLALGETQIVLEMKKFLESNGVRLEVFDEVNPKRSKTIILAKNLPAGTSVDELQEKFAQFGIVDKIILPPSGVTCLIQFNDPSEARKAFKKLAYSKFKHLPLFLEWAPEKVIDDSKDGVKGNDDEVKEVEEAAVTSSASEPKPEKLMEEKEEEEEDDTPPEQNTTIFIKNLSVETTETTLRNAFKHLGTIHTIQVAKRHNPENPKQQTPLGYGFIQFKQASSAEKSLKTMQFSEIDDQRIELKRSDRTLQAQVHAERKVMKKKKQNSTKIMVKNIPFQAKPAEIRDIFKTFGELKAVRLPNKQGSDQHRGFGFVDFVNKSDAKNAFEALHLSTHLYGRRLVLDWAETDQDVEDIRKRTAQQMGASDGNTKAKKLKKSLLKDEDFIKLNSDDEEEEAD